jgi:hypothetical protein
MIRVLHSYGNIKEDTYQSRTYLGRYRTKLSVPSLTSVDFHAGVYGNTV